MAIGRIIFAKSGEFGPFLKKWKILPYRLKSYFFRQGFWRKFSIERKDALGLCVTLSVVPFNGHKSMFHYMGPKTCITGPQTVSWTAIRNVFGQHQTYLIQENGQTGKRESSSSTLVLLPANKRHVADVIALIFGQP